MKKLLILFLVLVLFASSAAADGITWHSVFGLSEGATPEELEETIRTIFSVEPSNVDENMYFPSHKYLYDMPIRWIIKNTYGTELAAPYVYMEIEFEEECLTAENLVFLYKKLCEEFGEPTICSLVRKTITINGEEDILIEPDDLEGLKLSIDQMNLDGLICWDNVSMECYDKVGTFTGTEQKTFSIGVAYNYASLKWEVKKLYRKEEN